MSVKLSLVNVQGSKLKEASNLYYGCFSEFLDVNHEEKKGDEFEINTTLVYYCHDFFKTINMFIDFIIQFYKIL